MFNKQSLKQKLGDERYNSIKNELEALETETLMARLERDVRRSTLTRAQATQAVQSFFDKMKEV